MTSFHACLEVLVIVKMGTIPRDPVKKEILALIRAFPMTPIDTDNDCSWQPKASNIIFSSSNVYYIHSSLIRFAGINSALFSNRSH